MGFKELNPWGGTWQATVFWFSNGALENEVITLLRWDKSWTTKKLLVCRNGP